MLTLLLLWISGIGFAQNENALLWKITGNANEQPSYVFGTMHIMCEEDYFFPQQITEALQRCSAYYAEIDFTNTQALFALQKAMRTTVPLQERISTEDYQKLSELLEEKLQTSITTFEYSPLSIILSSITLKTISCQGKTKTYEIDLLQKALIQKMRVGGLEAAQDQFELLEQMTTAATLIKTLEEPNAAHEAHKMVELYKEQKIDALEQLTAILEATDREEIVIKRNEQWAKDVPRIMKQQPTFFGVGAAHLGGEHGLLQLLRLQGYTVEPVFF